MGSKLDHDPAFDILKEDPSISTCLILLTNTQMVMKTIPPLWR